MTPYRAQKTLRENIRTALADRGLKYRALAEVLDLPVAHVGNRMNAQWWHRHEVEAVAAFFDMGHDELLGDSLYKGDPEIRRRRMAELDEARRERRERKAAQEAERKAAAEARRHSARALCCDCGSLNLVDTRDMTDAWLGGSARQALQGRWVGTHSCGQCGKETRHAVLKDAATADGLEDVLRKKTAEQEAREKVTALVTRLVGFNIDVHYRSLGKRKYRMKNGTPIGGVEYDESKSQWRVELNHEVPAIAQLPVLEEMWRVISTDDQEWWSDIEGGRTAGAWVFGAPGQVEVWSAVADALVDEIGRALDVEHTKLILETRDAIDTEVER
jgi:hypothetical protein